MDLRTYKNLGVKPVIVFWSDMNYGVRSVSVLWACKICFHIFYGVKSVIVLWSDGVEPVIVFWSDINQDDEAIIVFWVYKTVGVEHVFVINPMQTNVLNLCVLVRCKSGCKCVWIRQNPLFWFLKDFLSLNFLIVLWSDKINVWNI